MINFAAETHVDTSISNPLNFVNTNVLGTTTLLKACSKYLSENKQINNNFKYIQVSTDEVFGDLELGLRLLVKIVLFVRVLHILPQRLVLI